MWKRLKHPNIVPFLGVLVDIPPLEIVHDWMENGMVIDYVRKQPRLDRFGVVSGFACVVTILADVEHRSCGMWRRAFTTSTCIT